MDLPSIANYAFLNLRLEREISIACVSFYFGILCYSAHSFWFQGSLPSTSLNSSGDSYATSQPLVNNVTQSIPTQSKVIQPVRCVVCNIDCNSKDVFQKHISGKKHLRNLQNQHNPSTATLKRSCNTINKVSLPSQELEMKRQKLLNGGAAVDSVRVCTVCNIACNGQEAFNDHLSGKKHAAQVITLLSSLAFSLIDSHLILVFLFCFKIALL